MSSGALTMAGALLLGVAASGHCLVMCGGISNALVLATARDAHGKQRRDLLVGYQAGRIFSYALAGLLVGGIAGGAIALLDSEPVRFVLRGLAALAMVFAALVALDIARDPGKRWGRALWSRLAPLGRRLLPVASLPRAFAIGTIWGWMPCGFVYSVLLIAALSLDPLRAAGTMAAFGLGTAPALLAVAFGLQHWVKRINVRALRAIASGVLVASAVLTLAGPWLVTHHVPWMHALLPYDCASPER